MDAIKVEKYLKRCDEEILSPAIAAGLDQECYYGYLQEVYRVISVDCAFSVTYKGMMERAHEELLWAYRQNIDVKWVTHLAEVFSLQLDLVELLMGFACENASREIYGVIRAQVDFMKLVLQRQHYSFDMITFYAQSNWLLGKTKPASEISSLMVRNHEMMTELERLFVEEK